MKTRRTWVVVLALLLIIIGALAWRFEWIKHINPDTLIKYEPGSYLVKTAVDGDTIIVDMNGSDEIIRFIGVDTPETHKPDSPVECFGPDAATYTKKLTEGKRIRLVADKLTTNRDRYDRLLRYVVLDNGTYLNRDLIDRGYAFAYDFPFARSSEYNRAEDTARLAKKGLWGSCTPTQNPTTGQWHSNPIETSSQLLE